MESVEKLRFSIIENDLKWNSENVAINLEDDRKSISSEGSCSEVGYGQEIGIENFINHYQEQNNRMIWDGKEILDTLKMTKGSDRILEMVTCGEFYGLPPASPEVHLALLFSSWYNCKENVVTLLDQFSANVNGIDPKGRAALHFSCSTGNVQISKILLDRGADPNLWDIEYKATPLHCAANAGSTECILLLLKRGAQINVGIEKRSALHFAIDRNAIDCVELLLKYGANANTPQVFTETPLHTACALGHKEIVKMLLDAGADVRSQFGKQRLTALHLAAEDNYVECVKLLIRKGAMVDVRNAENQTPLHLACLSHSLEALEMLIKYKADVNAVYRNGRSSLHAAIVKQSRCVDCLRSLIKNGANVNTVDDYGYTPLHMAAINEFTSAVQLLIDNGADITAKTNGGMSALSLITRRTPEVMSNFETKFDQSIKVNDNEIGDVDCEIRLDFRILVPIPTSQRGESELLLSFIEAGQKRFLSHPLVETFLFLKWRRIRILYYLILSYYLFYAVMFTIYIMNVFAKSCGGCSEDTDNCDPKCLETPEFISSVGILVWILNLTLLGKEIFQMAHGIKGYVYYWENWLQIIILIGVFACVTPINSYKTDIRPDWQHHVAAFAIFFTWLEAMMLVGRLPIFGLYIQMFTKVAMNFAKFLLAYFCLLVAFSLSFNVLFGNYKAFKSVLSSILKTVTMMAGELEFEDIFYDENGKSQARFPLSSHIMFMSFVLLVTVILTNLLVGLAVNDIQGLQVSAGLDRSIRQANLIYRLESLLHSRLLIKIPHKLLNFCKQSALLRTSRYGLQFTTRPNDSRDKRLPEEIKLSIYKLVVRRKEISRNAYWQKRLYNRQRSQNKDENAVLQKMCFYDNERVSYNQQTSHNSNDNNEMDVFFRPKTKSLIMPDEVFPNDHMINSDIKTISRCINSLGENVKYIKDQVRGLQDTLDKVNQSLSVKMEMTKKELRRIKMFLEQHDRGF